MVFKAKALSSLFFLIIILTGKVFAQGDVTLLVIPNLDSKIFLDGVEKGSTKAGSALRIITNAGEHYAEAQSLTGLTKGEVIQLEAGKQKIVKFEFDLKEQNYPLEVIQVANINFEIPGFIEAISDDPAKSYPYPTFYYAFEKGDEITLNVSMSNKKGTNSIEISTYPDGVVRFTNNAFSELKDAKFKVPQRAIYKLKFATNHIFPRNCFLKVDRTPVAKETASFNTKVSLKRILTPVSIHETQNFFINSGSNATFMGGKSRVLVQVTLPPNTQEWFYRFSASRDEKDIQNVKENFGLLKDVTSVLLNLSGVGAAVNTLAVDRLAQPPGANYCDVYFLESQYYDAFQNKRDTEWKYFTEGSRQNYKSGNAKVTCCKSGTFYLGIRNPDSSYGVNVSLEVVAITAKEELVMEQL